MKPRVLRKIAAEVFFLSKAYYDLFELLEEDTEADGFFRSLPEYAREIIEDRAEKIQSIKDLKATAETLK